MPRQGQNQRELSFPEDVLPCFSRVLPSTPAHNMSNHEPEAVRTLGALCDKTRRPFTMTQRMGRGTWPPMSLNPTLAPRHAPQTRRDPVESKLRSAEFLSSPGSRGPSRS